MIQTYNEGDVADGPGGQTMVFRGGRWTPQRGAIGGPIVIGTPDPGKAERDSLDTERKRLEVKQLRDKLARDDAPPLSPTGGKTGEASLAGKSPAYANIVRGYAAGNLTFGRNPLTNPQSRALLQDVINYDPSFDMTDYNARAKANAAFRTGPQGQNIVALNTALEHAMTVKGDIDALGNSSGLGSSLVNWARNTYRGWRDDPRVSVLPNDMQAFGSEAEKVFVPAGGTQGGREGWQSSIGVNDGPKTQNAILQHDAGLFRSRLEALQYQARQAVGPGAKIEDFLSPGARQAYATLVGPSAVGDSKSPAPVIGGPVLPGNGSAPSNPPGGGSPPAPTGGPPPTQPNLNPVVNTPTLSLATGTTRNVLDRGASAKLEQMVRGGASVEDIQSAFPGTKAAEIKAVRDYLPAHPDYSGFGRVENVENNTWWNRAAASPAGAFAIGAADSIVPTKLVLSQDEQGKVDALKDAYPGASLAGNIVGGIPATMAIEAKAAQLLPNALKWAPRLADGAYGAWQGYGNADEGQGATSAIIGGIGSTVLGMAGRGATRAVGKAVGGVVDPSVQYLRNQGIPLTVGQTAGGIVKGVEDRLSSIPFVGDVVRDRRREGIAAFDQAAFDQGLAPIGASTNGAIREPGVEQANNAVDGAYRNALDGVHVTADAPYVAATQARLTEGQALPDPMRGNVAATMPLRVGNSFDPNGGLTGRDFQQSVRGLRMDAASVEDQPYGWDFGNITRAAEGDLIGLLDRQAPGAVPAYLDANQAFRNVGVIRDAVNAGRNGARTGDPGLFAPSQLADASAANAKRFGGTQGTTDQPFFDLTRAGQAVLPSSVPDSGTTGRYAMLALPGVLTAAGGGAGYEGGDTQTGSELGLGLGVLATLAGSRGAQRGLVSALADRPDFLRLVGSQIYDHAAVGGVPLVAASSQIPALTAPR